MIYELYMYTVIEDHYKWPYMLSVFPLSYKLSMACFIRIGTEEDIRGIPHFLGPTQH